MRATNLPLLLISLLLSLISSKSCINGSHLEHSHQMHSANLQLINSLQDQEETSHQNFGESEEQFSENLVESLASSAAALATGVANSDAPQCERIQFELCATMPYNLTRVPNFFQDKNQFEAAERSKLYKQLAMSQCSRHLLAYLCELLAPVCLDGEAMKRFEIYPCRSFCRQVKFDCELQLMQQMRPQLLNLAFQCDQLPYESNGGSGNLSGPCHEAPESGAIQAGSGKQQQRKPASSQPTTASYAPYQPELELITETAQLDLGVLRPASIPKRTSGNNQQAQDDKQANLFDRLQALGQWLSWALLRYSNLLSLATLICLLVLLNIKRLNKLGRSIGSQMCPSSRKSSSSSASSSVGSQRKLAGAQSSPSGAVGKVSPSSSARSLMLFAAGHQHKLLPVGQHHLSQHHQRPLIDGHHQARAYHEQKLLGQRTLVNVNGTLERLSRYQHQQHQYDYVQCGSQQSRLASDYESSGSSSRPRRGQSLSSQARGSPRQQQTGGTQLYSNILLSSPSHQVLLFGGEEEQRPPLPPISRTQFHRAGHQLGPISSSQRAHSRPYRPHDTQQQFAAAHNHLEMVNNNNQTLPNDSNQSSPSSSSSLNSARSSNSMQHQVLMSSPFQQQTTTTTTKQTTTNLIVDK